jgi:hypothetical protein
MATLIVAGVVAVLALAAPLATLAQGTVFVVLVVFTLVNAALIAEKTQRRSTRSSPFHRPGLGAGDRPDHQRGSFRDLHFRVVRLSLARSLLGFSACDPKEVAMATVLLLGNLRASLTLARSLARAGHRIVAGMDAPDPYLFLSRHVAHVFPPRAAGC